MKPCMSDPLGQDGATSDRLSRCQLCDVKSCTQRVIPVGTVSALKTQVAGDHYRNMAIQPFQYIHANGIPFAEGCVIKYVSRWRAKGGVDDLRKAKHFLDLLIEAEQTKS